MSLKIDRAELEIVIKNDNSRKRMRELEDDMRRIRKEMKGLDENSPTFQGKLAELKKAQLEYDNLVDKIGLAGLSMKELRKRQQELNAILAKLPGNSPLYDKYKKQIDEVNSRIKELRGSASDTESSLSKMANGVNKYFNLMVTGAAAITGASMAFRSMAEDVAEMDDIYSDVMKTTGMTREEVLLLNNEFKKMDTRTSRDQLNKLAVDAGKLGIEGRDDILGFVRAGNMINVALGEDLGEDAIKNIGKLTQTFSRSTRELQDLDLEGKMLAVGSAINTIGQSSTAQESYLVEFAKRVSGAFSQANISIQDALGYASALDQTGQNVEMSATAVQQFLMKVLAEPQKFAKIAGLSLQEFNKILKEDTNDALITVLRSLSEKGGFQQLIPVFDQMGLDGARAVGVLSSLASNINLVTDAQRISNKAFNEGSSIIVEYNTKNNNLAAELEKRQKDFKEVQLQLGEKLNPVLLSSTKLITYVTKSLVVLINHWGTVGKLLLIIAGYWAAYNSKLIWNNIILKEGIGLKVKDLALKAKDAIILQALIIQEAARAAMIGKTTVATKAAAVAQIIWNNAIKANPLGFILTLITTVAAGIWLLTSRTKQLSQTQESSLSIQNKVNEQMTDHEAKVRSLVSILNNEKIALSERKKALNELKSIIPGYHAELTNEGKLINNNASAIRAYLVELEKEIRLQAAKDELIELYRKKRQQEKDVTKTKADYDSAKSNSPNSMYEGYNANVLMIATKQANDATNALNQTNAAIKSIEKEIESVKIAPKVTPGPKEGDQQEIDGKWFTYKGGKWVENKITIPDGGDDPNKSRVKSLDDELAKETLKLKENYTTREKYEADLLELTVKYIKKKRDLYKKDSAEWVQYQSQLADIDLKKQQDLNALMLDSIRSSNKSILQSIDVFENTKREDIQKAYDDGLIDTETYNSRLIDLDIVVAEKRHANAKKYLELISNAVFDSEEEKKKAVEDATAAVTNSETALLAANAKNIKQKQNDEKEHLEKVAAMRKELGLDKEKLSYKEGLEALKQKLKDAEASEKESADAILNYKLGRIGEYADEAAKLSQRVYSSVQNFETAALNNTETRYRKQISAAKKAGKDTTALEEKKEQELSKVRAKYADAKFILQIAQIGAETAQAAIVSFTEGMKLGGPVLAGVLAGAATLFGFSQIAIAKSERDAAKAGYKSGGYTGTGYNDDEVAGDVHRNEFVVQAKGVRNPHVRKFLDVFNNAQLNGTIHMLNTTQILERVKTETIQTGYKSGGYVTGNDQSSAYLDLLIPAILKLSNATDDLNSNIERGIVAKSVISGDSGSYEQTQRYIKLLKGASRDT